MKSYKKKHLKVISKLLCLMMVVQFFCFDSITAFAAGNANITFTTVGVPNVGESIEILVNAENAQNLYGASVDFTYDPSMLEIQNVEKGSLFNGSNAVVPVATFGNGEGSIAMAMSGSNASINGSGTLAVIKAKVLQEGSFNLKATESNDSLSLNGKTFRVKLANEIGKRESYTSVDSEINTVASELKVASINTDKPAPQSVNTTVRISPKATGGTGKYRYKFWIDDGSGWVIPQDFSSKDYYDWTPTKVGTHKIWIDVLDSNGNFAVNEITFEVSSALTVNSITTDKAAPQTVGTTIRVTPKVTGGTGTYRYKFWIDEGNGWTVPQDFSSKNYYDWKPSKPGTHKIWVDVLDSNGNFAVNEITYKVTADTVQQLQVSSITTDKASPRMLGSTIRITPKVTGGKGPYRYKFWIDEGDGWTVPQDFSSKNYYDWTPSKPGTHKVWIDVLDADGNFAVNDISYVITSSLTVDSITTDKASPQLAGTTIKVMPKVSGGKGPYKYKFWIDEGNGWTVPQDFSYREYYNWTPTKPGTHKIWVDILDADGNFAVNDITYEIKSSLTPELKVNSITTDKPSPQNLGETIRITPKVTGGKGPYRYKFWIDEGNGWTVPQDFSSKNYYDWKPSKPGTHKIWIDVLDAEGNFAVNQITYVVNAGLKVEAINTDKASPQLTGTTIKVMPKVTGGKGPYRYKFWIDEGNGWTVPQDFSSKNYYDWKPSKPGTHKIWVDILDADGNFAVNQITYEIKANSTSVLKVDSIKTDKPSPQNVGTTVRILPQVSGGKGPYKYKFWIDEGNGWTVPQDFSYREYFDWTPTKGGTHKIWVDILDADGNFAVNQITYEVTSTLAISSLTTNKTSPQPSNSTIRVEAKGVGGVGTLQYKFWIYDGSNWVITQDYSTKNYFDWVPERAGDHIIWVDVKDDTNKYVSREMPFKVSGYAISVGYVNSVDGVNVRSGPGTNYNILGGLGNKSRVEIVDSSNPSWYKIKYGSGYGYVHKDYIASYKGLDYYVDQQIKNMNLTDKGGQWVDATRDEVKYYMDPLNFLSNDGKFMFAKLNYSSSIPEEAVVKIVDGKGILSGKSNAFLEGAKKYNVNPLYLACHARLETGNGTSTLANGVLVRMVENVPVEPKVVYNMYGIGALDGSNDYVIKTGSERAYKEGWFTPEAAITEGAHWISNNYINNSSYYQDTLYKMRWNLSFDGVGWHQYATDIGWAYKQSKMMAPILNDYIKYLEFEIPEFN